MTKTRYLAPFIKADLEDKVVLLSGPRQVGKTTLSQNLFKRFDYLNFDNGEDRILLLKKEWDRAKDLLILDEIHKMRLWKTWLKGVYDKEKSKIPIIVTGSARLDIFKKAGDSLAGRHFHYRLHPFDLKELKGTDKPTAIYTKLMQVSGFPEPYVRGQLSFYNRWRRSHLDSILRQDLLSLELIKDIATFETMILLLQSRIGSPLSANALARDLQCDHKTVSRWLQIAQYLYIGFFVRPFSKNIARSVLKESKFYLFDLGRIDADESLKLENLVALALKKEVDFCNDAKGLDLDLHSLRLKGGREIDFLVTRKNAPPVLIEVKLSEDKPSPNFSLFTKYFPQSRKIQLVKNLSREKTTADGVELREVTAWLTDLDLEKA